MGSHHPEWPYRSSTTHHVEPATQSCRDVLGWGARYWTSPGRGTSPARGPACILTERQPSTWSKGRAVRPPLGAVQARPELLPCWCKERSARCLPPLDAVQARPGAPYCQPNSARDAGHQRLGVPTTQDVPTIPQPRPPSCMQVVRKGLFLPIRSSPLIMVPCSGASNLGTIIPRSAALQQLGVCLILHFLIALSMPCQQ